MSKTKQTTWVYRLLANSRFWVLMSGIVLSICVAGFVQLFVPSGNLQTIRIQQAYGFISVMLLFLALLASPLTKAYPNLPVNNVYLHVRRALGVLTFYYAVLHSGLAFFKQLGGPGGIQYYSSEYNWSLLFGVIALGILSVMAATSLDLAVKALSFKRWKLLHRLVYLAGVGILAHIALIGSHYEGVNLLSAVTASMVLVLLWFEGRRLYRNFRTKHNKADRT